MNAWVRNLYRSVDKTSVYPRRFKSTYSSFHLLHTHWLWVCVEVWLFAQICMVSMHLCVAVGVYQQNGCMPSKSPPPHTSRSKVPCTFQCSQAGCLPASCPPTTAYGNAYWDSSTLSKLPVCPSPCLPRCLVKLPKLAKACQSSHWMTIRPSNIQQAEVPLSFSHKSLGWHIKVAGLWGLEEA